MSFRYPLDQINITQNWGDNPDYYAQFGQLGHNGIDLGCSVGTPVLASDNGTVFYEGQGINQPLMGSIAGICIIIDHGSVMTGYAHLSSTTINTGQTVEKGQLIGYSGMTGVGTGPHLHFEFIGKPVDINNGYYGRINPSQYLERDIKMVDKNLIGLYYRALLGREVDSAGLKNIGLPADVVFTRLMQSPEYGKRQAMITNALKGGTVLKAGNYKVK